MGLYRIARRLNVAPGVLEGFIGVEVETDRPVVAKRVSGAWRPSVSGPLGTNLAAMATKQVPGLTTLLEVGTSKEQLWLVQALVDGEALRHVMTVLAKQRGFIAPNEGLAVVGRVAALLSTLHARPEPIVHGDVCASTVLLMPDGNLFLTDAAVTVGMSPAAVGPARSEAFTLAPEQLTQGPSPATDVFRLGLLLYELAVGHPLFFTAEATQALVQCQRYTGLDRDAVSQVPEPWRTLVIEMLAVEPIDRPTAEMVDETLLKAAEKSGWGPPEADIARLLKRAFPERQALATLARGGTQLLEVTPVKTATSSEPPALGDELPRSSGRLSALPALGDEPTQPTGGFSAIPALGDEPPRPSGRYTALHPLGDEPPRPSGRYSALRPPSDELPRPSGGFSGLPAVPSPASPPMRASASPPPMRSSASPPAMHRPPDSPPSATIAVVGRIATRKMSRSELAAARAEVAEDQGPAPAVPSPPPTVDPNAPRDAKLGELLLEKSLITRAQLDEATQQVGTFGGTLAEALGSMGACDEDAIVVALAEVTKTPHVSSRKLAALVAPTEALSRVSLELARRLDLVPLGLKGGTQLVVAMKDPMDLLAQDALKAATGLRSIVAMRAGETAIRRARNRFYGQDSEDAPDWLDRGAPPTPLPPPLEASSPSASQEPPVVTGSLVSQVIAPAGDSSLAGGAGRLVLSLLPMMGERGQMVLTLSATAAGLATKLGASEADVERVRFAAVALGVANLHDGRPPFEVPTVGGLSKVLGEHGWNAVEALVSPWLDWPSILPEEPPAQAICLAFGFASHANNPRPRPSQLGGALASFRARFQLPAPLVEVLVAELSGPG